MTYRQLQNALIQIQKDEESDFRFQAKLHGAKIKDEERLFDPAPPERPTKVREFTGDQQKVIDQQVAETLRRKGQKH